MKKKGYINNSFVTRAKRRNIPVTYKTVVLVPYYDGYKNVLTQDMINEENIKYVIKHDYWLNKETITVPRNSILEFDGGSLHDGTIIGQDTFINDIGGLGLEKLFAEDIVREGTWRINGEQVQSDWNQSDNTKPDYIKHKPTIPEEVTVDTELSDTSENPVQNKVITKALNTDKSYDSTKHSGLGRKTLKLKEGESNVLTQEDFDVANTIYVVQYDFDLGGESVTIPANCVLEFDGGSLKNGFVNCNNTTINALTKDYINSVTFFGTYEFIPSIEKTDTSRIKMFSSFSMFNDGLSEESLAITKSTYEKMGVNKIWLCLILHYYSDTREVKIASWYERFYALGGTVTDVYKYLKEKCGWEIDCVKLHKNENFNNTTNEPAAYETYCKTLIDELSTLGIKKIFISNEEKTRTDAGSIWISSFCNIIDYAHSKGIKVGASMNNYSNTINSMDRTLLQKLDYPFENFYPALSFKDENVSESDLPLMISRVKKSITNSIKVLRQNKNGAEYGISECGIPPFTKALRYPWNWEPASLGTRDETGIVFDLYWKAILNGINGLGVYQLANWFLDEAPFPGINDESLKFINKEL